MIEAIATEAAAHWNGRPLRLPAHRQNTRFEIALPRRARAPLHW